MTSHSPGQPSLLQLEANTLPGIPEDEPTMQAVANIQAPQQFGETDSAYTARLSAQQWLTSGFQLNPAKYSPQTHVKGEPAKDDNTFAHIIKPPERPQPLAKPPVKEEPTSPHMENSENWRTRQPLSTTSSTNSQTRNKLDIPSGGHPKPLPTAPKEDPNTWPHMKETTQPPNAQQTAEWENQISLQRMQNEDLRINSYSTIPDQGIHFQGTKPIDVWGPKIEPPPPSEDLFQ